MNEASENGSRQSEAPLAFALVISGANYNCVQNSEGKWGLQHRITGEAVMPCAYDEIRPHPRSHSTFFVVFEGHPSIHEITRL